MPETQPRFQCRHIHSAGHRCASPSLRNEHFCYFHHTTRKPIAQSEIQLRRGKQATFTLPEPEDRTSIQLAIGEILRRLAANDIDPKRAGLMLYALQIASCNLSKSASTQPETVEEITVDDLHGPLAPKAEFQTAPNEKGLYEALMDQWAKDKEDDAAYEAEKAKAAELSEDACEGNFDIQATAEARILRRVNPSYPLDPRYRFQPQRYPATRAAEYDFGSGASK